MTIFPVLLKSVSFGLVLYPRSLESKFTVSSSSSSWNSMFQVQIHCLCSSSLFWVHHSQFKFIVPSWSALFQVHSSKYKFSVPSSNSLFRVQIHCSKFKFIVPSSNSLFRVRIHSSEFKFIVPSSNSLFRVQVHCSEFKFIVPSSSSLFRVHDPFFKFISQFSSLFPSAGKSFSTWAEFPGGKLADSPGRNPAFLFLHYSNFTSLSFNLACLFFFQIRLSLL